MVVFHCSDSRVLTHWVRHVILIILWSVAADSHARQTSHYDVVAEYIHQLATMREVQDTLSKELRVSNNQILDAIRGSTTIKLELTCNIHVFEAMQLDPPFEELLPNVINLYQQKIESSVLPNREPSVAT